MIQLTQKSSDLLVPLVNAKLYLRVDHSSEDTLITSLIKSVQEYMESYTSRAITNNTYKYIYDFKVGEYFGVFIKTRIGLISSLDSIKTYNSDQTETTYQATDFVYINDNQESKIIKKDGTVINIGDRFYAPLEIIFKAGFSTSNIPNDLMNCILKLLAHWYEYRESISPENMQDIPNSAINILNKYRIELL